MSLYEKCIAKLITGKKLNFPLVFITKSSFLVPKNIRQNSMHYFIMKTPNKQELQQITLIIYEILNLKNVWVYMKKLLQNHILF